MGCQPPRDRRSESDPLHADFTPREERGDLPQLDAFDIRIPRVVHVVIVPKDQPIRFQHTAHLGSHLLFSAGIKHRRKHGGLEHQIEHLIRELQPGGIALVESSRLWDRRLWIRRPGQR